MCSHIVCILSHAFPYTGISTVFIGVRRYIGSRVIVLRLVAYYGSTVRFVSVTLSFLHLLTRMLTPPNLTTTHSYAMLKSINDELPYKYSK